MTMFPIKNPKFATSAQMQKIAAFYETAMSPAKARTQIRIYEIDGWTRDRADQEIRRLEGLKKEGALLLPEGWDE